jgi:hypothetical protein
MTTPRLLKRLAPTVPLALTAALIVGSPAGAQEHPTLRVQVTLSKRVYLPGEDVLARLTFTNAGRGAVVGAGGGAVFVPSVLRSGTFEIERILGNARDWTQVRLPVSGLRFVADPRLRPGQSAQTDDELVNRGTLGPGGYRVRARLLTASGWLTSPWESFSVFGTPTSDQQRRDFLRVRDERVPRRRFELGQRFLLAYPMSPYTTRIQVQMATAAHELGEWTTVVRLGWPLLSQRLSPVERTALTGSVAEALWRLERYAEARALIREMAPEDAEALLERLQGHNLSSLPPRR